jgi:NADH-quinone oxidoreductase subunit D
MGYAPGSAGGPGPFRSKIGSASTNTTSTIPWPMPGVYVPDVITILASLYFILRDVDR